ncbi:MAG TPA: PEP-CTERM sorting domain-containing protein [Acidobacteriaceae bacterium]|nr:PEP-CTERM sorting domain-containing protein [Acidobacteriaceae bacterium]
MKNITKLVALGTIVAASTPFALATPVTPGGPVITATNAITVTDDGVVASISGGLSAATYTGNYAEYVIKDGTNPYGVDDLTFLITVSNNTGSPNGIEHVSDGSINGFSMFPSVNVGYLAGPGDMGSDAPLTIDETIYGTVEFNFTGTDNIAAGTGTQYLVIQTAATNYTTGNIGVIDSSTDTVDGFVPAAATPEPSSLALLGTGLMGATTLLRRRRNAGNVA